MVVAGIKCFYAAHKRGALLFAELTAAAISAHASLWVFLTQFEKMHNLALILQLHTL